MAELVATIVLFLLLSGVMAAIEAAVLSISPGEMEWLTAIFKSGEREIGTEAQIRLLAGIGRRAGRIAASEGQIIRRAFFLNDRTAADIMTPLDEVVALDAASTLADAAPKIADHSYSRYPVFGDSPHDIRGLAVASDVLTALTKGQDTKPVESVCLPALVVPSHMRCDRLLGCFRDRRTHLAIVSKGNRTLGVATLQDVLEERVGEIRDEKDWPRSLPVDFTYLHPRRFDVI